MAALPALVGAVFFVIGTVRGRPMKGWVRTTGVVVPPSGGWTMAAAMSGPTFRWTVDGLTYETTSMLQQRPEPRPGTLVPVRYDPRHPELAMMDTFVQSGRVFVMVGWILVGMGVLVGLAVWFVGHVGGFFVG